MFSQQLNKLPGRKTTIQKNHDSSQTPGGPSRNNAAQPLPQLSIQATTSNQRAIEGAIKAIRTINNYGTEKSR